MNKLNIYVDGPEELLIHEIFESSSVPMSCAQISRVLGKALEFEHAKWGFSRGAKTIKNYILNNTTYMSSEYVYEYDSENRDIIAITSKMVRWFKADGSVGMEKDVTPEPNIKQFGDIKRSIWNGRVDYLEQGAKDLAAIAQTLPEPYKSQYLQVAAAVDFVFDFYEVPIRSYRERGTLDWENAVLNETNPQIVAILDLPVRPADTLFPNGLTARESIIHQLKGIIP